jgi:cell division septation protein DedD
MKVEVEKRVIRFGVINAFYEQNFWSNIRSLQIGFRYDFPFAQTSISGKYGNKMTTFVQSARGSLVFDAKTHLASANNRSSVGKGGILIVPFFDLNNNGHFDSGEPRVFGVSLHVSGGRIEINKHDSTIRVYDLEPFTNYYVEIDRNSFENMAWKVPKATISVAIDPNQFKLLEVPVIVAGEVSGMVYLEDNTGQRGQGRILVGIYNQDGSFITSTLTESDGYFSYLGLKPGSFFVRIDINQLKKLEMNSKPTSIYFKIEPSIDGDIADGLEFIIKSIRKDSIAELPSPREQVEMPIEKKEINEKDSSEKPVVNTENPTVVSRDEMKNNQEGKARSIPEKEVKNQSHGIIVQIGAFKVFASAEAFREKLVKSIKMNVIIDFEAGFYKVRISGLKDHIEAESVVKILAGIGYSTAFILKRE